MSDLTVSLPADLAEFAARQASKEGFGSAEEYVRALVHKAETRERLEALLLEGLNSGPAVEMTPEDWADMRREVEERLRPDRAEV